MTASDLTRPDTDARAAFLSRFPEGRRSHVTNLFLAGPRAGLTDPTAIVARVVADLQNRITRTDFEPTRSRETLLLETIQDYPEEAEQFAAWALAYTRMPEEERAEGRRMQAQEHVSRWLSQQPATPAQVNYLRRLGHQGEICSKLHASQLIEHLVVQQNGGRHNG